MVGHSEDQPRSAGIVDFADLQRISRLKQKGAVRRYLQKRKIRFEVGSDGAPWTTIDMLNRALLPAQRTAEPNIEACHRPRRRRKGHVTE